MLAARRSTEPAEVIRAAVAAFNRGDVDALSAGTPGPGGEGRRLPAGACAEELELRSIHLLDGGRAVCDLALGETIDVVGIYAVDDGRITSACHYFSDLALLVRVGILSASDLDNAVRLELSA